MPSSSVRSGTRKNEKKALVSSKLTFFKILKTHKVALNKTYNFSFINFFKFAL